MSANLKEQEIVDAHMHLWSPATHPWVAKAGADGHPAGSFVDIATYLLEDYKRDIAGLRVVQSVHVQANWPGDQVGETTWLDGIADGDASGIPQAIVGCCDFSSPNVEEVLSRHCQSKSFRGIRQLLNYHPNHPEYSEVTHDNYLTDPQWQKGFALLEKYNLSFELHVLPHQASRAVEVFRQYPGVKVIVDHCLLPYERDDVTMKLWKEGLEQLAACPNVYCKVSGMFATDPKWDQASIERVVRPCLNIFGVERCVFASNFPVDRINGTFPQLLEALAPIMQGYTQEERDGFFAGNARKFYRL